MKRGSCSAYLWVAIGSWSPLAVATIDHRSSNDKNGKPLVTTSLDLFSITENLFGWRSIASIHISISHCLYVYAASQPVILKSQPEMETQAEKQMELLDTSRYELHFQGAEAVGWVCIHSFCCNLSTINSPNAHPRRWSLFHPSTFLTFTASMVWQISQPSSHNKTKILQKV